MRNLLLGSFYLKPYEHRDNFTLILIRKTTLHDKFIVKFKAVLCFIVIRYIIVPKMTCNSYYMFDLLVNRN